MSFLKYVKEYADHIGGQYTDYDQNRSVVVVPLESRFQTVLATTQKSLASGKDQAVFSSKVCDITSNSIDFKQLIEQNANFDFSKFIIHDGYLKIEASCLTASVTKEQIQEMIQEVAHLSDEYELKLTGKDVF